MGVELSRVVGLEGLQMLDLKWSSIKSNWWVRRFHDALEDPDDNAVDNFLRDRAGVWWCCFLSNPDFLKKLVRLNRSEGGSASCPKQASLLFAC